jgi:hypothetical protein
MAPDEFRVYSFHHILKPEAILFLGQAGIENHLEKKVAQFFFKRVKIARADRINDFIGLFQQEPLNRIVILGAVPRTAVWSAEARHQINQPGKTFSCHLNSWTSLPALEIR